MATLPARPIMGPVASHGRDLERKTDWVRPISPAAVAELHAALRAVPGRGRAWRDMTLADSASPRFEQARFS
jgi:hypothetical protein